MLRRRFSGEMEKFEQQLAEILWTIGFHFQADGITPTRSPELLLDAAEKVLR